MAWFDLPEAELDAYRISTPEPPGLDDWWAERLREAEADAIPTTTKRHREDVYGPVEVLDVTFSGAHADPVRAWLLLPAGRSGPVPVAVSFIGYGGGRGVPVEHLALPALGIAAFVMDTRGQGGSWSVGETGDPGRPGDGPEHPGVMTRGLATPEGYYYTRLMTDAARAVEVAAGFGEIDGDRIAVCGASQGGALALAAAALRPDLVSVCQADVPFLCDIQRAVGLSPTYPYREVADFLAHQIDLVPRALDTLRYVDCALLARRIRAKSLLSVGLMDQICPPSTVYAAFHEISSAKELAVHRFSGHDVPVRHQERRIEHLRRWL